MTWLRTTLFLLSPFVSSSPTEDRKKLYRDTIVAEYPGSTVNPCPCSTTTTTSGGNVDSRDPSIPIWPFTGLPSPVGMIERFLCRIPCNETTTGDMDLTQVVRALYINTDPDYAVAVKSGLQEQYETGKLRFWLQPSERHFCYWTDNHIILWLSSTYLLRQGEFVIFDDARDDAAVKCEQRLRHYLDLKLEYGFYEFLSTNYARFILAALLNLVDFAVDTEIQAKALQAATRLLEEWLLVTNEQGAFYPASSRNLVRHYKQRRFEAISWFLTGLGPSVVNGNWRNDYVGAFLATSRIELEPIVAKWNTTVSVDVELYNGHPIYDHKWVHYYLDRDDRILFQWSAGAYFTPATAWETDDLVRRYDLADHVLLKDFGVIFKLPSSMVVGVAKIIPGNSKGTDISEANVHIYKNRGVVLTSLENYNVGLRSSEQWIWSATVGDIAVWTQSGVTGPPFEPAVGDVSNTHIPHIRQEANVALISYRPRPDVLLPSQLLPHFGVDFSSQVSLFFPEDRFDEVLQYDRWLLGRQDESYIGVWRHGLQKTNCTEAEDPRDCDEFYFSDPIHGFVHRCGP